MKKLLPFLIIALCLLSLPLEASTQKLPDINQTDFIIHTWGGGPLLAKVFNAISVLMYGETGYKGLLTIGLTIGGFGACIIAFSKGSIQSILSHWFFPALLICGIIMAPRDKITIKDHLISKSASEKFGSVWVVKDVPYIMKLFCTTVSTMSYRFTHGLERVTHGVDDSTYNWTGHIYAGDTLFQAGKVQINNPFLEKNVHNFVYDCVFNDISMEVPLYTKKDLWQQKDIMGFLVPRTSIWLSTRQTDNSGESQPMRCNKAAENIKAKFDRMEIGGPLSTFSSMKGDINSDLKTTIFGEISSEAQQLMGLKNAAMKNHKKLLQQSYMIDATHKALDPNAYSTKKAEQVHKQTQGILGAMGAKSIVAMKNFFEAIVYLAFPIVLILSICSLGFRSLMTWAQFLIWIALWPPFFVIVNFLLNTTWDLRVEKLFGKADLGLTMFSSSGLADLYSSMESIAAGALFSVPFLAFAIVKGGVSSMMHLAGTLNAPAQGAATQAANEQVSGNYSVGNFSYGNENISSRNMLKWDDTPALSQGAMTHKSGTLQATLGNDGSLVLDKPQGNFGADINANKVYGQGINEQYNKSINQMNSASESVNESFQNAANSGTSYMDSLSKDNSFSHLESKSEQDSAAELFNKTDQQISDFAENYGVSKSQVIDAGARLNAGIDIKGFGLGGNFSSSGSLRDETGETVAERDSSLKSINENIQSLQQYTNQNSQSENLSSSQKASQDYSEQLSKTESFTKQYQESISENQAWTDLKQYYESQDTSAKQSLNNEFSTHLMETYDDIGKINQILANPQKMGQEIHGFTTKKHEEMLQSNQYNKLTSNELKDKTSTQNRLESMVKSSQVKQQVGARMERGETLKNSAEGLRSEYGGCSKKKINNEIHAEDQINEKRKLFESTKVPQERKDAVKDQAKNESIAHQSGRMAKEIGGGIGKIAKKVSKASTIISTTQKPIGFD